MPLMLGRRLDVIDGLDVARPLGRFRCFDALEVQVYS